MAKASVVESRGKINQIGSTIRPFKKLPNANEHSYLMNCYYLVRGRPLQETNISASVTANLAPQTSGSNAQAQNMTNCQEKASKVIQSP